MFFFHPHKPSLTPRKPMGRKQDLQRAVSIHRSGRGGLGMESHGTFRRCSENVEKPMKHIWKTDVKIWV